MDAVSKTNMLLDLLVEPKILLPEENDGDDWRKLCLRATVPLSLPNGVSIKDIR